MVKICWPFIVTLLLGSALIFRVEPLRAQSSGRALFERLRAPDPVPVIIHQDPRVESLLARYMDLTRQKKGMEGYRIQIFHGTGNEARNKARAMQSRFMTQFPEIACYLLYQEPYFKVRVGDFRNRVEAYQVYRKITENYPDAFLVSDNEIQFPHLNTEP